MWKNNFFYDFVISDFNGELFESIESVDLAMDNF